MTYRSFTIRIGESGVAYFSENCVRSIKPHKVYDPFREELDFSSLASVKYL